MPIDFRGDSKRLKTIFVSLLKYSQSGMNEGNIYIVVDFDGVKD